MTKRKNKGKAPVTAIASTDLPTDLAVLHMTETAAPEIVEDVVAALEASDEGFTDFPATADEPSSNDFDALMAQVPDAEVDAKLTATVTAIDERAEFEKVKDPANAKIQGTLKKVREQLATKRAARLMCVTAIDPSVLNRTIHEGARYNVYAMGKLGDAIYGLTNADDGQRGGIRNAINLACMRSLFKFRAAGVQFSGEMAKCAASDKIRVERAVNEMLVRHTVSASTAPTQASSTMQALETLGIVKRSGSGKNPNFDLTTAPIVGKLEQVLAA